MDAGSSPVSLWCRWYPPASPRLPHQYVEVVLRSQQPLLIFLEEPPVALCLSAPAREWLTLVYQAVRDGAVPDVLLVPVGISYDVVPGGLHREGAVRGLAGVGAAPKLPAACPGSGACLHHPVNALVPSPPSTVLGPSASALASGQRAGPYAETSAASGWTSPSPSPYRYSSGVASSCLDPPRPWRVYSCDVGGCASLWGLDGGVWGGWGDLVCSRGSGKPISRGSWGLAGAPGTQGIRSACWC